MILAFRSVIEVTTWKRRIVTDMRKVLNFLNDEEGATGVEYSILAAAIAAVIIAIVISIGLKTNDNFKKLDGKW